MLAALVNAAGASSGTGAALLPLRKGGFLIGFGRRSQIDGKSGDDEITTIECWCAIVAGEEEKAAAVAILDLSSRETPMRPARRTRAPRLVENGSLGIEHGNGDCWTTGSSSPASRDLATGGLGAVTLRWRSGMEFGTSTNRGAKQCGQVGRALPRTSRGIS